MGKDARVIVGLALMATLGLRISPAQHADDFRITSVRLADNGETVALRFSAEGSEQTLDVSTAGLGGTHFFRVVAEDGEIGTTYRVEISPSLRAETWTEAGGTAAPKGFELIPAGSFQMGDTFGESSSSELPVHSVSVSAFYMGKYEVTKGLWDEVRAWGVGNGYPDLRPGGGKGADHPVHTVSWYDVVKWCNARSERDGLAPCYTVGGAVYRAGESAPECAWNANGYRLPSEAEWEKAARGGLAGRRYPWGNTISHGQANYYASGDAGDRYGNQSGNAGYHPTYEVGNFPYSSPVGSFAANGYGLYDMAGNMWEWCWDWYGSYPSSAVTDPHGPTSGTYRVFRGGGWFEYGGAYSCRAAYRFNDGPDGRINYIGFRIARSSVP